MDIEITLDVEMARSKMSLTELSQRIGISMTNLSLLKNGKVKGIRFATLAAICDALNCQPGDILSRPSLQPADVAGQHSAPVRGE